MSYESRWDIDYINCQYDLIIKRLSIIFLPYISLNSWEFYSLAYHSIVSSAPKPNEESAITSLFGSSLAYAYEASETASMRVTAALFHAASSLPPLSQTTVSLFSTALSYKLNSPAFSATARLRFAWSQLGSWRICMNGSTNIGN